MNVTELISHCRNLGASLIPLDDHLKIQAAQPLPDDVLNRLREAKPEVLKELRKELGENTKCWVLEEWRRVSIPSWRKILMESIVAGDLSREHYARWMLSDILEDTEQRETVND